MPVTGEQENDSIVNSLLLLHGALVFLMQVGFLLLEVGFGRAKNVRNVLLKDAVNVLTCALCWWACGYAFSTGNSAGGFIGINGFFTETGTDPNTEDVSNATRPWFFTWTFALSTVSIVSGCLAERTALTAYPLLAALLSSCVHPLAAHWAWCGTSWLRARVVGGCGFLDYAGGMAVHGVGGLTGLIGAALCGPRIGRFENGLVKPMPGHDVSSVAIGAVFLWFGWFGFNCGSAYVWAGSTGAAAAAADRVALNMTLSASAAGLSALTVHSLMTGTLDLCTLVNALLAGLVMSTPSAGFIASWAALVGGLLAGGLYLLGARMALKLQIDDPLDSSAIHCLCGTVGTLLTGLLAQPKHVKALTGYTCGGLFYSASLPEKGRSGALLLGMQTLGAASTLLWTAVWALAFFWTLKRLGRLRVEQAVELAGLDAVDHGGPAYPEFSLVAHPGTDSGGER